MAPTPTAVLGRRGDLDRHARREGRARAAEGDGRPHAQEERRIRTVTRGASGLAAQSGAPAMVALAGEFRPSHLLMPASKWKERTGACSSDREQRVWRD